MMYLTGATDAGAIASGGIGLLLTQHKRNDSQIPRYPYWAADNGCFSRGDQFNAPAYLRWLRDLPCRDCCLFAVAPDRFDPSGMWRGETIARATIERSLPVLPQIRALGYPAALVAQNGLEDEQVPWEQFDVLFIGGNTAWKCGEAAAWLCQEAHRRGKSVHMGRVNSQRRLRAAQSMGVDSCDGTMLAYKPQARLQQLRRWLHEMDRQPSLWQEVTP